VLHGFTRSAQFVGPVEFGVAEPDTEPDADPHSDAHP